MSALLRTLDAFPRGRTTEEVLVLMGAGFAHAKRVRLLAELDELLATGRAVKGRDGKWRSSKTYMPRADGRGGGSSQIGAATSDVLTAAPARFALEQSVEGDLTENLSDTIAPSALLRYWRSALRADPRGATSAVGDLHGIDWQLIAGRGPIVPVHDGAVKISILLDDLSDEFRQALLRRESLDNALAVGWPLAVGRKAGVPVVWPVGLLSASWTRTSSHLEILVEADDVLVNSEWIHGAARSTSWSRAGLAAVFADGDTVGQQAEDFLLKLREAASTQIKGKVTGDAMASQIDLKSSGIFDAAALFLPGESSFTAGASKDLDKIATWPAERLARSALGSVLGLGSNIDGGAITPINLGPLNGEQLKAVRHAVAAPLSVVTGPPGTGKSQAIVSMAASVILGGGSVMVASKNHQALDAVEERLGGIAPEVTFVVRTLDPSREIDRSFADVLGEMLVADGAVSLMHSDQDVLRQIRVLAAERLGALDAMGAKSRLEIEIAEVLERLEMRDPATVSREATEAFPKPTLWQRLLLFISKIFMPRKGEGHDAVASHNKPQSEMSYRELERHLDFLRNKSADIVLDGDVISLAKDIEELCVAYLPKEMQRRGQLGEQRRLDLAEAKDNHDFQGGGALPSDIGKMILEHRPMWLVSVLGAPRRIPLDDGLFDLVIFDEASQCDIASAMPLFARAKRAVVVGDNRQLSFIPQLGRAQDRNLMQAQGLPSKGMGRFSQSRLSLFDFALRVPDTPRVTLRHQYRSAGQIVDYISSEFYGGELVVAQPPEGARVPKGSKPGIAWTHIAAPAIPSKGNVNTNEASAIAGEVKNLLVDQGYDGSIGVITPFRAQIMVIRESVDLLVPQNVLERADFRVGTVDGFQGQERDLILFSPVLGANSPTTGVSFVQKDARRLNVAISRARAVAHVIGDLEFARSAKVKALARLAACATEPRKQAGEGVFDSGWERRMYHALKDRGLEPYAQHEIAGRYLDFALFGKNGVKLDLEVDGRRWHQTADGRRKSSDLWRDEQLKSLGWRVRRFWVDELSQNMEACLDLVEQDLS